jgi:L,D-transpeptidase catalytic domain
VLRKVANLLVGAIPAAVFAFTLTSAAPASAQFIFDIFNPPEPVEPPQYYHYRPEPQREEEPRYRSHRRHHHHEVRSRQRRHRTAHEDSWKPKSVKGPFQIVIAIGPQELLLYGQDGLIARAPISTGMPDHPTPKGVFTVLSKSRWHRSNIYSGAPMPWMQRITWSGVAMHEGPRPGYPASHGCIRLPGDFAVRLFHTTKVGARVVVTRDAVAPVPISSPKLFVPMQPEVKAQAEPVTVAAAGEAAAPMTFAARSSKGKSSDADSSDADSSGDNQSAGDSKASPDIGAAKNPAATGAIALPEPAPPASEQHKPSGPVSVFVSLKQGKVFVRQGFEELFDLPATIADPDRPIGTHVYTAMGPTEDGKAMRWTAISIPSTYRQHRHYVRRHHRHKDAEHADDAAQPVSSAAQALDRITLPPEAVQRISELLVPGSSLIVSDNALSDETDDSTGFIVLTQ